MKIHAVVEYVVTKLDVLVPHGGGPNSVVDVVVSVASSDTGVDIGIVKEKGRGWCPSGLVWW